MKKSVLIVSLLAGLSFTACTNSTTATPRTVYQQPTEQKMNAFTPVMTQVALSTREDPSYKKMDILPEDKQWFKMLMYRLWDRQITRSQFVAEGNAKYPGHQYEFNFIANGFQKRS
jgi:hypothetical protein